MDWTDEQRAELGREYARVGYVAGEHWPAPPPELTPTQLMELFRRIPDGAGRAGYAAVLAEIVKPR